jgi:A/G-specific adenine glycosylase
MPEPPAISRLLIEWYEGVRRDLPWRRTKDPWHILLSEVMLQQTRVAAVLPYYEKFLSRFPTPGDMARASEREVLALWSGLGYYARARNLRKAARAIHEAGGFPRTYEQIRRLPGVGEYTAAAVASIAFGLPHAVLDGNVIRVVSRLTADAGDIASPATRARLRMTADRLLDPARPAAFNQAMMELGATVCLPRGPQCLLCPLRDRCEARGRAIEQELPIKLRKRDPLKIAVQLLLAEKDGSILLRQRDSAEGRLADFWELPDGRDLPRAERLERLGSFRHSITRHDYDVEVWRVRPGKAPKGFRWIRQEDLHGLPLATTVRKALRVAGRPLEPSVSG